MGGCQKHLVSIIQAIPFCNRDFHFLLNLTRSFHVLSFPIQLARAVGVQSVNARAVDWQRCQFPLQISLFSLFSFFLFFFSVVYLSHGRSSLIKKLIFLILTGAPNNLEVDTLRHFRAPQRPFWILQGLQAVSNDPSADRLLLLEIWLFTFQYNSYFPRQSISISFHSSQSNPSESNSFRSIISNQVLSS